MGSLSEKALDGNVSARRLFDWRMFLINCQVIDSDLRVFSRLLRTKARRSVGSAAWPLEILDAFVVRWLGPAKARYRSVGAGSAG